MMFTKEHMTGMTNEEESGSPSWGASLFMQTKEDVAKAVSTAANSPTSSVNVAHSSKDDSSGSQLQRLQNQVTKMLKGFSRPPDVVNTNYNPEILTSLKRQWAANFQLQNMVRYNVNVPEFCVPSGILSINHEGSLSCLLL